MGALHAGHLKLIQAARGECDSVVVSIFVNPLQFDRQEDLSRYPRSLDEDMKVCRDHGVDIVFTPTAAELYPSTSLGTGPTPGPSTRQARWGGTPPACTVDVGRLGDHLCGKYRPGHFRGVATVVLKLFQIVQPGRAYFGEKDAQQLAIIKRMVSDFNVPVSIVEVPTVREADGLALSSRNRHLTASERQLAATLYQALCEAQRQISKGEREVGIVRNAAMMRIPQSDELRIEYLEIVDPVGMQPVESIAGPVRVAAALWVGATRLIDNVLCDPSIGTLIGSR